MKIAKKSNNNNKSLANIATEYEENCKSQPNKSNIKTEYDNLNIHENLLTKNEEQLEMMDISNFQFSKIELDGQFDINEDSNNVKEALFDGAVADLMTNSNNIDLEETNNVIPNKRSLQRKKKITSSKLQLTVRTTPRHYSKMFEFFEKNPGLATGQLQKISYRKKWRELTNILNAEGLGEKSTEKWQKTWSDYKLHLRKKISCLKQNHEVDVSNQFTEQEERALSIVGLSLAEDSMIQAIQKRFNPTAPESDDSSSHSTVQSTTQKNNTHVASSTQDVNPTSTSNGPRKSPKYIQQQLRYKRLMYRKKSNQYRERTLKELKLLRCTLTSGLNRIGDILERLVDKTDNTSLVSNGDLSKAANTIVNTTTNIVNSLHNGNLLQ